MTETHDVGSLLDMDSEEVPRAKFDLTGGEYNYCQIVRTPGMASEKARLLAEHKKTIEVLLELGVRHTARDEIGDQTYTGGRLYFQRPGPGRLAYHRGRGLAWREWDSRTSYDYEDGTSTLIPLDNPEGEWMSDVGLIPEGMSVVK